MGQLILLVVAAAWAAVLLPPLLRSRVENRPNSSVSDFRDRLFTLQRALPTRGVSVRTIGRPLAPSTFARPAAPGRPGVRTAPAARRGRETTRRETGRRDAGRMYEASVRPRHHGADDVAVRAELKRRRANVLFVLVLTAVCAGFLAFTTDSKAMVYAFALSFLGLGAYGYLLATLNQRELALAGGASPDQRAATRSSRRSHAVADVDEYELDDVETPAPMHAPAPVERARRVVMPASAPIREPAQPARRVRPTDDSTRPIGADRRIADRAVRESDGYTLPGSGLSGRISYGRRIEPTVDQTPAPAALPAASSRTSFVAGDPLLGNGAGPVVAPPDSSAYGFESYDRPVGRRMPPARNGRHATGQHAAVKARQAKALHSGFYPQVG